MMSDFLTTLKNQVLLGDGALGTMLVKNGLPRGQNPELWMLSHPGIIKTIHRAYLDAGSQVVQTNTFGANSLKLKEYQASHLVKEINHTAALLVREVVGKKAFVGGIIGPTGHFPAPLGDISWPQLVEVFAEQAKSLDEGGVDFIFLETFSDLGEIRAALYAVKNHTSLPAACSLTYTKGRTLTGTSPEVAAVVLSALGADIIGANCSTGPSELLDVMKAYRQSTDLPLLVEPNAGMPVLVDGETIYPETPQDMAAYIEKFRQAGVNLIGACCGSTPDHIRAMSAAFASRSPVSPSPPSGHVCTRLASRSRVVSFGGNRPPVIIGERINPTARPTIAQALREGRWDIITQEGSVQVEAGAALLDLNVGLAGADESGLLAEGVARLQMALDTPLVLDTADPAALEKGLQQYQGKALINSVNGEDKRLENILPLAKKYGAAVIGLTLDERGIPDSAGSRFEIAEKILRRAGEYGIPREDILIDCLVLSAAVSPELAMETVRAISLVKERLGTTTVLGLSNVSHGLPQRSWLNAAFLALSLGAGLDAVIANPADGRIRETLAAVSLLAGRDKGARNYLAVAGKVAPSPAAPPPREEISLATLAALIAQGRQEPLVPLLEQLLKEFSPLAIINNGIIPPLEKMGEQFARGEAYLPQLMLSSDVAKAAFSFLKMQLPATTAASKGTVVIGTVRGDIHDIGKNITAALLESHGYKVIDLGKNVEAATFLQAVRKEKAQIVGLSALMTTTMTEMEPVIQLIKRECNEVKVIIGGAVVTADYARQIGADGYGKDAVAAVKLVGSLLEAK